MQGGLPKDERNSTAHKPNYTTMEQADIEGFEREGTAEMVNDPRFYTENVIDKRLAAFEAVAIVMEIMASEAIKQCYELPMEFELIGPYWHVAVFQAIGFALMISVLYMATVATAVLSLQLFFSIRLMTAGPTGFDKSAGFYTDKRMWQYRENAIFGVKWGVVCFFLSTGFMLYVKIWEAGASEETVEHDEKAGRPEHKIAAAVTLAIFLWLSAQLTVMVKTHQKVFDENYQSIDSCHPGELNRHLTSRGR